MPRTLTALGPYNTAMNSLLLQFVALGTSLVLALPPGWCSFCVRPSESKSVPAKATCCHRPASKHPADSSKAPARPSVQCCCLRDATLPEKPIQQDDSTGLTLPVVADHVALDLVSTTAGVAALAPISTGPPLHVLQCVWRC
jgi:hypothetical protein